MNKISDTVYKEVKGSYLKQIEVPRIKPKTHYILCPIGLVGAGKTTVVKPLAKLLSLVRVSGDEIRKLFKERGYGYDRAKEMVYEIANHFLKKGFSIAIDSDCISEESKKRIKEAKNKYSLKIVWIHINPSEKFILNKLRNLKPNWLGTGEEMVDNYFARKPLHEKLDFPFAYTFDTSRENMDEQIKDSARVIAESLKSRH